MTAAAHGESAPAPHPIFLYDGVCGLCNRGVQFILRRDPGAVFRFASLQSAFARRVLGRHGYRADDLDTVYVVIDHDLPGETLLSRSDAVIFVLKKLPGAVVALWRGILQVLPKALRDWGYRVVARNRYCIFGRYETCPMPTPETRSRFLDQ